MWSLADIIPADSIEPGDTVYLSGEFVTVTKVEDADDTLTVFGIEDEWEEPGEWEIPVGSTVDLCVWV